MIKTCKQFNTNFQNSNFNLLFFLLIFPILFPLQLLLSKNIFLIILSLLFLFNSFHFFTYLLFLNLILDSVTPNILPLPLLLIFLIIFKHSTLIPSLFHLNLIFSIHFQLSVKLFSSVHQKITQPSYSHF